jgi:hypothetical protein
MTLIIFFPKLLLFILHVFLNSIKLFFVSGYSINYRKSLLRVNMKNQYNLSTNLIIKPIFLIIVFCQTRSYKKGRREYKRFNLNGLTN